MTDFLKTLLILTVAGTLCGLFLVVLRKLSQGKLPSSFLYFAWIIVVLRFVIPVSGLIPIGAVDLPDPSYTEPQQIVTETEVTVVPSTYSHANTPVQPAQNEPAAHQFSSSEKSVAKKTLSIPTIMFIVWCCGTAGFLLWNIVSYLRFASLLRKSLSEPSAGDVILYDDVWGDRKPVLKRSKAVAAPLTFGIADPVLVIPDTEYEDIALKNVFRHEIIHFKRNDILLKWFFLLVFSAHWFNPFVWYFRKEINRVCELSCDEKLLKRMNADEKRSYGETLLAIAENSCEAPCRMITGFSEGKKDLKERLIQIMSFKKKSKVALALALIPVLVLCGCAVALGPKAEKTPDADSVTVSNVDELLAAIAPNTEIHLAEGTYNLTEAANYGKDCAGNYNWISYGFENQYELCIEDIDNLTLIGDNAEILTVPRAANVLAFRKCDQLTLQGLTVGHTVAAEACEGGVILLESCVDTVIDNCRLYGCGTVGVWAEQSSNLKVKDTEMYHCSSAGISFWAAASLLVDGCKIYDCGKEGAYQQAAGAFLLDNASDVAVRNCEIYDNYFQTLIQGSPRKSTFDDISVHDNHINNVFSDGGLQFSKLSFNNNIINKWISNTTSQNNTISIDGAETSEADLVKMWGKQMSSAGVGTVEADYQPIDRTGAKEVHVKTADEFLSAIASNTAIYIDVPQIDLTSASDYGEGAAEEWLRPEFGDKAYAWVYCYDGYELFIGNVSNFHIVGGEIVTRPRYANVLNYLNCSNVTLDGVHLGHTPEQGVCRGGVLFFEKTDVIILEGCDLYGCGILGIMTRDVNNIHVQNTVIHDCSNGAAFLEKTREAVFLGCDVVNCPEPHFFLSGCDNFSWDGKLMDSHSSFNVNDNARDPYAEAFNSAPAPTPMPSESNIDLLDDEFHDRETAASAVCIFVDAYFKGNPEVMVAYLSKTTYIIDASEIKTYDGNPGLVDYYMGDGELVSCELSTPDDLIKNLGFIEGLDDIADNEPDGTLHRIKVHYWKTNASSPIYDKNVLEIDLVREDGGWKVARF